MLGGGVSGWYYSHFTLHNCVLWSNTDGGGDIEVAQVHLDGSTVSVDYSCIEGWSGGLGGAGNIGAAPGFVDADGADNTWGTEDDDLHLSVGSPCINTADPTFSPQPGQTDLDGYARVICGVVDMGACEFGIGDYDCNQVIDLDDYADWGLCMTGPDGGPYPVGCEALDFDYDLDVDTEDFIEFQQVLPG